MRIVEEVQTIAALCHVHDVLAVQGIICHLPIDNFLYSQAILIIHETGCGVNAWKRPPGWGPGGQGEKRLYRLSTHEIIQHTISATLPCFSQNTAVNDPNTDDEKG